MENLEVLKSGIRDLQIEMTTAIHAHQVLYVKMRDDSSLEEEIKPELGKLQQSIMDVNEKQKVLIQELRKELEMVALNGDASAFHFNLYSVKPGQLENKKRRRKELQVAPKIKPVVTVAYSPPSLSPSPTPSTSEESSMSDDSMDFDEVTPSQMPIPLPQPRQRPKLLPDAPTIFNTPLRRDLKPGRVRKSKQMMPDEEVFKDIPVYHDPPPSPEPTDEKDIKLRIIKALGLIPKEMLSEILNRKVERKRRSTANPHFVYNNDWEIPLWKRSKTYLSPHKSPLKMDDFKNKSQEIVRTQQPEAESSGGSKGDKSVTSTPASSPSAVDMSCCVCRISTGSLVTCKECTSTYHASCTEATEESSPVHCPQCSVHPSTKEIQESEERQGNQEHQEMQVDTSEEEFAAKCPNVAESYNKLQQYINAHKEVDPAALKAERETMKQELSTKNQELYTEKETLEQRAAELSEKLMAHEETKKTLMCKERELLANIQNIRDFVERYQATQKTNMEVDTKVDEVEKEVGRDSPVGTETTTTTQPELFDREEVYSDSSEHLEHLEHHSNQDSEDHHNSEEDGFEDHLEEQEDQLSEQHDSEDLLKEDGMPESMESMPNLFDFN